MDLFTAKRRLRVPSCISTTHRRMKAYFTAHHQLQILNVDLQSMNKVHMLERP